MHSKSEKSIQRRWKPTRSGLLNLFKYDQEEFRFEQGRMLLRGNNGTGKSRVLALQLPFLLDGETASHRVEPDGDPGKRFEWNLLMGKHSDRTGYTWVEFGRADEEGTEHYVTLGCGLKAVEGKGLSDRWFFITTQRIGSEGLSLLSIGGVPLGRDALDKALGTQGRIYRTAREYRLAIDETLFRLGERRYEALVNLLIQLRKPQLSREFNETFLSSALTEALAPLEGEVLSVIAEAYRGLDDDRNQLEGFVAAQKAVSAFLSEYSVYARIASRRRAQTVRKTHSAYEEVQRDLKKADAEFQLARDQFALAQQALERLRLEHAAAQERVRTLETSPEMRSARELEAAREDARKCENRAESAEADYRRAHESSESALRKKHEIGERVSSRRAKVIALASQTRQKAEIALLDISAFPAGEPTGDWQHSRIHAVMETRAKAIIELEDREKAIDSLESALETAKRLLGEAARRKSEAEARLEECGRVFRKEAADLEDLTRSWLAGLSHLKLTDPENLLGEMMEWCESQFGDFPPRQAAQAALSEIHQTMDIRKGSLVKEAEGLGLRRSEIERERQELESGRHEGPGSRAGVNAVRRQGALGTPFWKAVDFVPQVSELARAGVEAALEASGILDAWITPEGTLLNAGEEEILFDLASSLSATDGVGLARWLTPAIDREDAQQAGISDSLVKRLLCTIGTEAGESLAWIAEDGSWRLGPLSGRWSKAAAQHIGQGARAAERRRKLKELAESMGQLEADLARNQAELEEVERIRRESSVEARSVPSSGACADASRKRGLAHDALGLAHRGLQASERDVLSIRLRCEEAALEYDELAKAFGIPGTRGRLRELREALGAVERSLSELASGTALLEEAKSAWIDAEAMSVRALDEYDRLGQLKQHTLEELAKARALRAELQASVGSTVEEVLARLAETKRSWVALVEEIEVQDRSRDLASNDRARLEERVTNHGEKLAEESQRREEAITGLKAFATTGLLKTASAELEADNGELSVTGWVDLSRKIESLLLSVDASDTAWERRSKVIYSSFMTLQTALGALAYRAEGVTVGEFFVVKIPFQQRLCPVDEIDRVFSHEVEERQRLLEAREREVIENHLVGEVSAHIHDRLHAAEAWVQMVNHELDERPTSTGMKLRFDWITSEEGPMGFPEARRCLMRAAATWTEADRSAVADFLRQRLHAERIANVNRTWLENLSAAFDYRSWHRFVVERQQDGRWLRLTKRTFGTGSGGEKALMLTMPQFSAAAAHYRSADDLAPRLILLDEAFVGIDNDSRAKAMGLLATFDLDLVMTSEREWACYPTVPAIAIYQLSARAGVDAVLATRWVWDGSKRSRSDSKIPWTN